MIILGIDPGIGLTGYGVVEEQKSHAALLEHGCIRTPAHAPLPERLKLIFQGLDALCRRFTLDCVAVEQLFFNTNVTTALAVGQARGVAVLVAAQHGLEVVEYTPLQVKQAVTGYGRADKTQVQRMVQSLLGLKDIIRPDDAADAVAICLCHLQSYRYRRAVSKGERNV
ncbi:MAG: Crossover junction endodeoxyribonuclease RuvC [Firmicutes bacterium]|nr:Crossover junction endodeoxyribonuclease RuvC [candidate division NPL-UPA2 bacterium]MBT9156358.1 Crossover junction endodeoxyribonuclease RuvC [candidate division NPL-UPA2 bacterium]